MRGQVLYLNFISINNLTSLYSNGILRRLHLTGLGLSRCFDSSITIFNGSGSVVLFIRDTF